MTVITEPDGSQVNTVACEGRPVNWSDRSGTIPAGGSLTVMVANRNRRGAWIMNTSASASVTVTVGGTAFPLAAGQLYEFPAIGVSVDAVTLSGAVGTTFAAAEW